MFSTIARKIDNTLFGGRVYRIFKNRQQQKFLESVRNGCELQFVVYYNGDKTNLLAELCDKYGSDKGSVSCSTRPYSWPPHTYTDFYRRHFDHTRQSVKKVFECGLGTNQPELVSSMGENGKPGASLRTWRDYFPNAQVYGADIDKTILFQEERIQTAYVDQTDPSAIAQYWTTINVQDFDLMIDDGLHTFEAGVCLFENSIAKLAKGGIYVIEDVLMCDLVKYEKYFSGKPHRVDFVTLYSPERTLSMPYDNALVIVHG